MQHIDENPQGKATPVISWMGDDKKSQYYNIPAVCAIDKKISQDPWTEDEFIRQVASREHQDRTYQPSIGVVARINDKVLGYMVYHLHKTYAEVIKFGIDPEITDKGLRKNVATMMFCRLENLFLIQGKKQIVFDVHESDTETLSLLTNRKYKMIKTIEKYDEYENSAFTMLYTKDAVRDRGSKNCDPRTYDKNEFRTL